MEINDSLAGREVFILLQSVFDRMEGELEGKTALTQGLSATGDKRGWCNHDIMLSRCFLFLDLSPCLCHLSIAWCDHGSDR